MLAERGGIHKMFRAIDEDKSGWASRKEMRMLMLNLNLETIIKPKVRAPTEYCSRRLHGACQERGRAGE